MCVFVWWYEDGFFECVFVLWCDGDGCEMMVGDVVDVLCVCDCVCDEEDDDVDDVCVCEGEGVSDGVVDDDCDDGGARGDDARASALDD